jgi:hypothetical protein
MPARRPHVTRCGDLETSCTDVSLTCCSTLLLYLQLNGSGQNPNMYLTRRSTVGVTGFEPATSSSRTKRATKLRHTP